MPLAILSQSHELFQNCVGGQAFQRKKGFSAILILAHSACPLIYGKRLGHHGTGGLAEGPASGSSKWLSRLKECSLGALQRVVEGGCCIKVIGEIVGPGRLRSCPLPPGVPSPVHVQCIMGAYVQFLTLSCICKRSSWYLVFLLWKVFSIYIKDP